MATWIPGGDKSDNVEISDFRMFTNIDFGFKISSNVIIENEYWKAFSFDW